MAFMIWQAMSMSGATTGIRAHITVPVRRTTQQARRVASLVFIAAAVGSTMPGAAGLRLATTTGRTLAASTTGFVSSWT